MNVMVIEIPQNEEVSGAGKNGGEKESVFLFVEEERTRGHKR